MIYEIISIFVVIILILIFIYIYIKKVEIKEIIPEEIRVYANNIIIKKPNDEIIPENPFNCTADDLKPCKIDDASTCFGCKNLTSVCVNFSQDTKYKNSEGKEIIVPKNETENDGYCLNIKTLEDSCNVYHGEFILVALDKDGYANALICLCKNPGFIGNETILGNCTTPFICNGSVVDINKPLSEIECMCDKYTISKHIDNVPSCVDKTVETMTKADFEEIWNRREVDLIYTHIVIPEIAKNIKAESIPDPCKYDIITGNYLPNNRLELLGLKDSPRTAYCRNTDKDTKIINIRNTDANILLNHNLGGSFPIAVNGATLTMQSFCNPEIPTFQQIVFKIPGKDNKHLIDDEKFNVYIYGKRDILGITTRIDIGNFSDYIAVCDHGVSYTPFFATRSAARQDLKIWKDEKYTVADYIRMNWNDDKVDDIGRKTRDTTWRKQCPNPWGCSEWNNLLDGEGEGVFNYYQIMIGGRPFLMYDMDFKYNNLSKIALLGGEFETNKFTTFVSNRSSEKNKLIYPDRWKLQTEGMGF